MRAGGGEAGQKATGRGWGGASGTFHLENLFLYLLQPPQHPRKGQCSLAGRRQGGEVFWATQLQVRLGPGSPGSARTLTPSRHLLELSEHLSRDKHRGELGERERQSSFPPRPSEAPTVRGPHEDQRQREPSPIGLQGYPLRLHQSYLTPLLTI